MGKHSLNPFTKETKTRLSFIAWSIKKVQATQMTLSKTEKVIPSTCIWECVSDCGCVGWVWDCIWKWDSHSLCMFLCLCMLECVAVSGRGTLWVAEDEVGQPVMSPTSLIVWDEFWIVLPCDLLMLSTLWTKPTWEWKGLYNVNSHNPSWGKWGH